MAEPQRAHQILPVRTIPDGIEVTKPGEMARWLRLIYQDVGQAFQRQQADLNNDPRLKDDRIATGVRGMGNAIRYVDNPASLAGAVATLLSRYEWTFADAAAPGPGGVVPSIGVTDGDKGDITVSVGGTVWNIDANAVGTAEIADSAVTAAKIADRTRSLFVAPGGFEILSGTPTKTNVRAATTAADRALAWTFTAVADAYIVGNSFIPSDWASGTVEFFVHWASIGGAADVGGFFTDLNARGMVPSTDAINAASTAVATDKILPTTIGVDLNYYRTSFGTLSTDVAAGRIVKMTFGRDTAAEIAANGLATAQTLAVLGIEIAYTADS